MSKLHLTDYIEQFTPTITDVADQLWSFAEISLQEVRSAALLQAVLQAHQFTITHATVGTLDTAFVAEYGSGTPIIGVLAEYDALPGLSNAAVPEQQPYSNDVTSGHGCGHNLIGAGALGAVLVLQAAMQAEALPGTVRLYGAPAEEVGVGKVLMAQAGVFDDLDACLHWHPAHLAGAFTVSTTANLRMEIVFEGTTAHAAISPWQGRSALHAAELFGHGISLMREHLEPTARVHYIYTDAGEAVNIVVGHTTLALQVRDATMAQVQQTAAWIRQIAEGAAMATQTSCTLTIQRGVHDLISNTPLAERATQHLQQLLPLEYSPEELAFVYAVQRAVGVPEAGMNSSVLPPTETKIGGSTDVGDVSKITPMMGVAVQSIPLGVSLHTWAATACHGTSIGHKAAVTAAHALALLGYDLLTDASLREAARSDFEQRVQGVPYQSATAAMTATLRDDEDDILGKRFG